MIGRLVIEIARDSMSVAASVFPDGKTNITEELIRRELLERGIVTGIIDTKIKELLHYEAYRRLWMIAKGTPAERGKDGWYEFLFDKDIKEYEPKIREDGSVDYSPNIVMAQRGEKIAVYHEPIPGKMGVTVFGATIAPIASRDAKQMKLINVLQKGNEFFATEKGRVSVKDNRLAVMNRLVINGNAGYATGMIDFNGDVYIKGDVKDGVVMNVEGGLEVGGVIDAAKIRVGGDVVCHGGIHGKQKALIEVNGTLTANFIEEATIVTRRDVIAGHIINAKIISHSNVNVRGRDGAILGGIIEAEECISAIRVGNEKGCITSLKITSTDAWGREYARVIVRDKVYPETRVEINGVVDRDCRLENGELHVTQRGLERFEIGKYEYHDVLELLESESGQEYVQEREVPEENKPEEKKLILVVDDDPVFLKTQYAYLVADYSVGVVNSGEDALKYLQKNKPQLILLDYLMPKMKGSELLQQIRALPSEEADIPVFFLTSVTDKQVVAQCLSLYPQKYLIKPMEKDELLKIIGDFFAGEQK